YLEDFDDLSVAIDRLRDPSDPVLDWHQVRRELLDTD
ncbi:MAG: CopG family transcriptional regulator, partial [Gammaproteobacteria bacterium]|nr:CopG family transcriptional regulator [Gammaproteobacteria bacterium]